MSTRSTPVTEEHFRYLAEHTRGDDAFLLSLKDAAAAAGMPAISIAPEQASMMQVLLKAARAREVVEVGTLAGYSAISMARALPPEGRVRTIEICDSHADFAEEWVRRSDVAGKVEVHRGDARVVLAGFAGESADAAFIDADKDGYLCYLDQCLRVVRRLGLIMVDNAFAFGRLFEKEPDDPEVPTVRAFNDHLARRGGLHPVIVPVGDGCWVAVKE